MKKNNYYRLNQLKKLIQFIQIPINSNHLQLIKIKINFEKIN